MAGSPVPCSIFVVGQGSAAWLYRTSSNITPDASSSSPPPLRRLMRTSRRPWRTSGREEVVPCKPTALHGHRASGSRRARGGAAPASSQRRRFPDFFRPAIFFLISGNAELPFPPGPSLYVVHVVANGGPPSQSRIRGCAKAIEMHRRKTGARFMARSANVCMCVYGYLVVYL